MDASVSPDGKRVVYCVMTMHPIRIGKHEVIHWGIKVCVLDLEDKGRAVVVFEEPGRRIEGASSINSPSAVRWSPDGSRIGFLYCNHNFYLQTSIKASWRVGVVGADGCGAKTVFASDRTNAELTTFDWR